VKLAVFSDIHSNIEALDACLLRAAELGADGYVCLGDTVNYGADPTATLDRLLAIPGLTTVLGNHDEGMFLEPSWSPSSEIERAAAWTRQQLQARHIAFLRDLPYLHQAHGAAFAHATFDFPNSWDYIVDARGAKRCFAAVPDVAALFLGHVHVPLVFEATADGKVLKIEPPAQRSYLLPAGSRCLVNVGSVGQPRDGDNAACFVVYDSVARSIEFERVRYAFTRTAEKIRRAGLHEFYAERLAVGQ
jgi:diadenosine tetraphosphatase ApaH/serine/threonine PP2A family protein phosphatase